MTQPAQVAATAVATPEAFAAQVVAGCAPVVLRGHAAHWPVVQAARAGDAALADYLLTFDTGLTAEAFVGAPAIAGRYHYGDGPDGFNFTRESMTIPKALARILDAAGDPQAATAYLGSLPTPSYLPGFAEENAAPTLPGVAPRIWIGNASHVACHYDTYENLACVVAGRRRFTLYPPDALPDLYVGPIDHNMAGQPVSLAAGGPADDPRYPRFAAAASRAMTVELEPGDALFLPKLWWHQVEATAPVNMLVNYWWDAHAAGPDAPQTAMMLAMIAIAERPAAERAAWRAFFDHYVFRPDGHPLAHLPAERHGVLGPLAAGNYGRIRAMVMRLLRGG